MCGIAGFIDFKGQSAAPEVAAMACAQPHRGPDGQGIYVTYNSGVSIGFGHRRLSIIDLSTTANQPMHYHGLHIIFNGEIYNYNEIRNTLIAKGHEFVTHGDTEVILHSWKEWGEASIAQWRGMFAISIYDEEKNELICIRDRAGVKPFYYHWHNDIFLFGSELKALVAHPGFQKALYPAAVAAFLQFGYVPHPHCIYKHTHKLPPGHVLRFNLASKQIQLKQYWSVYEAYNQPKLNITLPDAISETERILTESFQYRMVADVPVGVFLSGGYDSTCVTALLQKNSTEKLKTFTIGSTDKKLDEAPFAKTIAERLGTDHTQYYCTPQEALDVIPELPFYYDEPFGDSSAIPTLLVSRIARKRVTVALSADAGDEIFAGYNRYDYSQRYGNLLRRIPAPLRSAGAAVMSAVSSDAIPYLRERPHFHSRYDKIKNVLRDPSPGALMKTLSQTFSPDELRQLFQNPMPPLPTRHEATDLQPDFYDALSFMMAVDYETYMVDDILQKVDRATMAASLEGREPFLDQHIIEWAARLPSNYKYHEGQKKYILKQIVHRYIPEPLMNRPKMGFAIPLDAWLQNELKDLVHTHLSEKSLQQHGLFNTAEVQKLVTRFFNGHTENYVKIWYLLMFQMWYHRWMA